MAECAVGGQPGVGVEVWGPQRTRMRPPLVKRQNYPCEAVFSFFSAFGFLALSADGVVS